MTSDPLHGPLEQAVTQEEVGVDPLKEDIWVDHQAHQEDPQMDRWVAITIKIGMILKGMIKAVI